MSNDANPLDADQAAALNRIRRLMMIASVTTFVAIAIVFGVIGFKVYKSADAAPPLAAAEASLPPGAKVLSTAIGDRRLVLTLDIAGAVELRSFDLETLRPIGRLRLESKP